MNLARILVAVNSPNGRDAAFEHALRLARPSGAELYLLHAVPVKQKFSFRAAERLERMAEMRKRAEETESACGPSNNTATPPRSSSSMPTRVKWT